MERSVHKALNPFALRVGEVERPDVPMGDRDDRVNAGHREPFSDGSEIIEGPGAEGEVVLQHELPSRRLGVLDDAIAFEVSANALHDMVESVRRFIDFCTSRPTLNRIINLEATGASDRLSWLGNT